ETVDVMKQWSEPDSHLGTGKYVYRRLVERAANGYAVIDTLQRKLVAVECVNLKGSKEARAQAVTPDVAARYVYLPHPDEHGNEWVHAYIDEMAKFPNAKNDDQVDATTQALLRLRVTGGANIVNPASRSPGLPATSRRTIQSARTGVRRSPAG